jgi:hypothetical protein
MTRQPISKLGAILLVVIVGYGAWLRASYLNHNLFWVDEAESTINALTILDKGYPSDQYEGIPLYENTLTREWPDSKEYEFKDSSYSDAGVAIYHGWLPLYSMAASLKAFGVHPDPAPADTSTYVPTVNHTDLEMRRMTLAARLPGVIFGTFFLLLLFFTAREMGGNDVAWATLIAATLAERTISISREARYYSATVLLGLACCLLIWRMLHRARWRDFILGGVVFVLMFHTHTVSFAVAGAAFAIAALPKLRSLDFIKKCAVFALIVAAGVLPWGILTGFFTQAAGIPAARPLLKFPDDYLLFPLGRPPTLIVLGVGVIGLFAADLFRKRLAPRFVDAFASRRGTFYFLGMWVVLGYLAFVFAMPAVSFVAKRMTLPMLGPGIILAGCIFSAVAHVILGRRSIVLTVALFLGFMGAVKGLKPSPIMYRNRITALSRQIQYTIEWLRLREPEMNPGTRVYSTPNKHLIFSVYTGIPVQNIAPVRRSFLNQYNGDILLLEAVVPLQPPRPTLVKDMAAHAGKELSDETCAELGWMITRRAVAQRTLGTVAEVDPKPEEVRIPQYVMQLVGESPAFTKRHIATSSSNPVDECPAVFRAYKDELRDWTDWWPIYFYRFVDPVKRKGKKFNYAERMRTGQCWVLPIGWRIYYSPASAASLGTPSGQKPAAATQPTTRPQ